MNPPVMSAGHGGQIMLSQEPADLVERYAAARADERHELVIDHLRRTVAKIVGASTPATIDISKGLFDMGMDSLMSVELKTQLEKSTGHAMPATLTFNYPTINDLAGFLETQVLVINKEQAPGKKAETPGSEPGHKQSVATPDDMDDLSEDELAAMLNARLDRRS
jgi:acyl carrier protein